MLSCWRRTRVTTSRRSDTRSGLTAPPRGLGKRVRYPSNDLRKPSSAPGMGQARRTTPLDSASSTRGLAVLFGRASTLQRGCSPEVKLSMSSGCRASGSAVLGFEDRAEDASAAGGRSSVDSRVGGLTTGGPGHDPARSSSAAPEAGVTRVRSEVRVVRRSIAHGHTGSNSFDLLSAVNSSLGARRAMTDVVGLTDRRAAGRRPEQVVDRQHGRPDTPRSASRVPRSPSVDAPAGPHRRPAKCSTRKPDEETAGPFEMRRDELPCALGHK